MTPGAVLPLRMWRYVGGIALRNIGLCIGAIAVSIALIDLVEQMAATAQMDGGGFGLALQFVVLRLPALLEQTLIFAVLIGVVLTYVSLSRHAEIIALRAAGYSAWQFVLPAVLVSGLLGVLAVLFFSPGAARLQGTYDSMKSARSMAVQTSADGRDTLIWKTLPLGNGVALVSGRPVAGDEAALRDVTVLVLPNDGRLVRFDAASGRREASDWVLTEARQNSVGGAQQQFARYVLRGSNAASGDAAQELAVEPRTLPVWSLPQAARFAAERGGSAGRYWVRFHRQLALPILLVAVTLVAALLSMGLERAGNRARLIGTAVAAGISIYLAAEIASGLATAGIAPAWLAAWAPPVLGLLLGLAVFSLREDG
jgi:lipopolysaccharide export system permease protein